MLKFLIVKYLSLSLNAARALLLASLLGPESFGLLGTLVVIQQYLSYVALGMREGLTVRLAQPESQREQGAHIHASALAWGVGVAMVVAIGVPAWAHATGRAQSYWAWVGIVSSLSIVNEIFININRDQNRLNKIALLELAYNAAPLACALWFASRVSVTLVLQSLAAGLVLSIAGYVAGAGPVVKAGPRLATVQRLLAIGIPLAVGSFFSSSITTVYILLANAMVGGKTVGLVVFGNSLCSIVLFGSNMVAWAATSRSMRHLSSDESRQSDPRANRIAILLRMAVVASTLLLAFSGFFLEFALPAYRGAEAYALMFCLLQSYSLLLYAELNFLAVHGHGRLIVLGYATILIGSTSVYLALPQIALLDLVVAAIALSGVLAFFCARISRRLGLLEDIGLPTMFLLFPALCAVGYRVWGAAAPIALALLYLGYSWAQYRARQKPLSP